MKKRYAVIVAIILMAILLVYLLVCNKVIRTAEKEIAFKLIKPLKTREQPPARDYIIPGRDVSNKGKANYGILLIKLDPSGNTQWIRSYPGKYYDWADAVIPVKDGGYIVAAKSYTFGEGYDGVYLLKVDARGNSQWARTFGPEAEGDATASVPMDDGSLIAGRTFSGDNKSYGVYLAKTGPEGDYRWMRTFGSDYFEWGYTAIGTKDGHFVTTGQAEDYRTGNTADVYLMQRDKKGAYSWSKYFGGDKYDWGYSIAQAKDNGFIIAGLTYSYGAGEDDAYVIKTDAEGNSRWARAFGGPGHDRAYSAEQIPGGGYIIAGATTSFGNGGYDAYIILTDAGGNTLWERTYGGNGDDSAHSVAQTKDNGFIIAGTTSSNW